MARKMTRDEAYRIAWFYGTSHIEAILQAANEPEKMTYPCVPIWNDIRKHWQEDLRRIKVLPSGSFQAL